MQPEQQQVNVLSSKGRGNLNLVLGYEGVGRVLVSSLGGDEPSLYNLSVSSVATMYRMSSTINREVTRVQTLLTPSAGYLSHQTSDVHAGSVGTVEPMDVEGWDGPQIPFLQSEWPSDSGQEQVQCSDVWSPDLVWFILLGKGKLSSFNSGDPSLHYLVSSNGLLNTLGWALGTREANNTVREVSCDLNAAVSSGQVRCSSKYPVEDQKVRLQQEPEKLASSDCLRDSVGAPPKAATVWGPCPHLQKGFCRYGDRCRYEHIVKCASTKPIPTRDWSAVLPFSGQQVCPHFQKGFCKRGQACAFLHIQPESKGPLHQAVGHGETMLVSPSKPKHPPLCAEARQELQSWNLLRECFQYHAGSCNHGKCLFRHSQLEPERKAALMKWIVPDTDPLRKGKPGLQPLPVSAGSAETNDLPTGTQDVSSTPVCATPGVLPNSSNPWGDVPAVPTPASVLDSPKPHTVARLQAPRPPLHWKGCAATGKLGTTIVATPCRHVGMTSKEGPLPAPRPLSQQPCSIASERPASTLVNYEYGDKRPPKGSLAHSTRSLSCSRKQTNLGRCPRSSSINPPGTQPRVVSLARMKKESQSSVITLSSNTFQRALWADIMDDDEDADLDGGGEVADDPTEGNDDTALFCASVLPSVTSSSASSPGPKELQDQDPVVSSPAAFVKPQRHDSIKGTDQVVLKGEHKPSKGIRSVINKPDADLGPRSFSAAGSKSSMEARTSGSGESSMPVFPTHVKGASDGLRPVYANRCDIKVRGRSLTPRSIRFSPEPVTNHRQVSHASRPKSLGSGVPRLLTLSPATRACSCDGARFSRVLPEVTPATPASSASACPAGAGGGVPAVMCFSQVAGFSKHGLRNESKGFNATLGYPGEGPSMSKAAPVTPPKDAPVMTPEVPGPKTPPKGYRPRTSHKDSRPKSPPNAKKPTPPKGPPPGVWSCEAPVKNLQRSEPASSGDVPPWTQDLEIEVRGLATAYLGRSSGDVGISLTESRRTLAPPKAKANRPQPPRPPAPRAKAQTRATEGTLSPKQMAVYKPPPPPRPRNRQEEDKGPRVVKARFDSGFDYQEARKNAAGSTSSMSAGYASLASLPQVRPPVPFNPAAHLSRVAEGVTSEGTGASKRETFETPRRYAKPTPKVKRSRSPRDSPDTGESQCGELGTRHPKDPPPVVGSPEVVIPNSVEPEATSTKASQGTGCDSAVKGSKLDDQGGTQLSIVRPEPAGVKVASPRIGGPKPGVSQGPGTLGTKSEYIGQVDALPISPNVRTTGIGHNTAGSASSGHEAEQLVCEREGSESKDSPKVGRLGASDLRASEPASTSTGAESALPMSHGSSSILQCASSTLNRERVEQRLVQQEYSALIEINANPNLSYRTVRMTHAPGKVEQLKVHASRRVLEILLLTWRSGFQLKELSRHVQGAEGSSVPMDASIRVPIGRLIVGSILTARYERDLRGHPAEINASLVQTLLESPQGSEANCRRCDPLRNARIFVQSSGENVPMLMNLRMQLRPYPIGTTCEEVLIELQLQSHTIVGLCRAFTHWMPIPGQFRMQPSWCTLVWPVPRSDGNS